MSKHFGLWELIKSIFKFILQKRKDSIVQDKQDAQEIHDKLENKYEKIDNEKDKNKQEAENFNDAVDKLNDIF